MLRCNHCLCNINDNFNNNNGMLDNIIKQKIINKILNPIFNKDVKNINTITNAFKHMLSESDMDMILYMICTPNYKALKRRDIVKWKPETWEVKDKFEMDRMIDAGLMVDGYLFGRVIDSSDYKDKFNPFYYEMKVEAFLIGKDGNLVPYEMNVKTLKLSKSKLPEIWKNTESLE